MNKTEMENKSSAYYTLKYEQTDSLHKKGEMVVIPSGELHIGQQDDCKVLFINDTVYENELYAIIRPTRNNGEWQLVPTSEHIKTSVNGNPVNLVHYLNDGDRITFNSEEQELLFKVHHDDKYDATQGVQVIAAPMPKKLLAFIIAMPVLLFSLIAVFLYNNYRIETEHEKLLADEELHKSILQISVDSVYYMLGNDTIGKYSYQIDEGHVINGTAFLTDDGRIITARHCIEPWLNDASVDDAERPEDVKSLPTRWAMIAETGNQINDNNSHRVIAICHLYRGQNATEPFGLAYKSSESQVDKSRDYIIEKGDFANIYYWRSIKETYSNNKMMLGDVAYIKSDSTGTIAIAEKKDITKWLKNRQQLYFLGYPDHNTMRGFNTEEGKIQMDYAEGEMIAHNGNLIHGYSGAPAIVIEGGKAYAVGVVSRIDANGGGRTYSVPVTELLRKGGKK